MLGIDLLMHARFSTYETRRVVVTSGLGITVRFQDWIGGDDLILQTWFVWIFNLTLLFANTGGHKGKILDNLFCVLGLTRTRLTTKRQWIRIEQRSVHASFPDLRNQHGLVLLVPAHSRIGAVSNQVQMWRDLVLLLASVQVNHLHGVQWQALEWIDGDAKETGVCVDVPVDVSFPQVVVDCGVVQKGQVRHVVAQFVFGRIHL